MISSDFPQQQPQNNVGLFDSEEKVKIICSPYIVTHKTLCMNEMKTINSKSSPKFFYIFKGTCSMTDDDNNFFEKSNGIRAIYIPQGRTLTINNIGNDSLKYLVVSFINPGEIEDLTGLEKPTRLIRHQQKGETYFESGGILVSNIGKPPQKTLKIPFHVIDCIIPKKCTKNIKSKKKKRYCIVLEGQGIASKKSGKTEPLFPGKSFSIKPKSALTIQNTQIERLLLFSI